MVRKNLKRGQILIVLSKRIASHLKSVRLIKGSISKSRDTDLLSCCSVFIATLPFKPALEVETLLERKWIMGFKYESQRDSFEAERNIVRGY
ncbi:hypothetical protein LEP1GSC050_3401 [Leptospira broomii serovar Hurstbridge str. 5399]|uniref:Uncharacterized protein n=1 Tax=Leptospira broomii serovar Hurstbridge str. 5399 TaxID=1049789 RepID=T0GCE0_9LEPT|nr:hypothetical protein LEP1GSC050_3401 [Leptospira broomii serovar Hurstbridge str. 5399]